jgi:hypothetical protein
MMGPSPERLLGETAHLAYHLKWPLDSILDLEHRDRRRFLADAESLASRSPALDRPGSEHEGQEI